MLVRTWTENARQGSVEIKHERVTAATITSVLQDLRAAYEAMFGLHQQLMYSLQTIIARGDGRPTTLTSCQAADPLARRPSRRGRLELHGGTPAAHRSLRITRQSRRLPCRSLVGMWGRLAA